MKHDQAEVSLVLGELDLAHGGVDHQEGRQQGPRTQGDAQGDDEALLLGVVDAGDQGREPHQPLVRHPDAVGDELVECRGRVLERLGVGAQAEHRDVAHAGHDPAEGADGRKHPAHPDGPEEGQHQVDLDTAGDPQVAGLGLGIDLPRARACGRFFDGVLERSGAGHVRHHHRHYHGYRQQQRTNEKNPVPHVHPP